MLHVASSHWLSPAGGDLRVSPWPAPLTEDRVGGSMGGGASQLPLTRVAGLPFPPVFTVTVKVVDKVTTRAPIVAGILAAVVNV